MRRKVRAYFVSFEGSFLIFVICLNEVTDSSLVAFFFDKLAVAFCDRRAVAVCAADEDNVVLAYSVTKKSCINISENENSADVSEVELLVAVRHTACDNRSFRKGRSVIL